MPPSKNVGNTIIEEEKNVKLFYALVNLDVSIVPYYIPRNHSHSFARDNIQSTKNRKTEPSARWIPTIITPPPRYTIKGKPSRNKPSSLYTHNYTQIKTLLYLQIYNTDVLCICYYYILLQIIQVNVTGAREYPFEFIYM